MEKFGKSPKPKSVPKPKSPFVNMNEEPLTVGNMMKVGVIMCCIMV